MEDSEGEGVIGAFLSTLSGGEASCGQSGLPGLAGSLGRGAARLGSVAEIVGRFERARVFPEHARVRVSSGVSEE